LPEKEETHNRRVDWRSYLPQPLTDPDGSNSDIRLFNNAALLRHRE
jgi:hypothetical protein